MKMLVYVPHVPHVPHTMWRGNECSCHNHYGRVEIPGAFLFWAIVILVVLNVVLYKIFKDD